MNTYVRYCSNESLYWLPIKNAKVAPFTGSMKEGYYWCPAVYVMLESIYFRLLSLLLYLVKGGWATQ